jgi:hypothetical protein
VISQILSPEGNGLIGHSGENLGNGEKVFDIREPFLNNVMFHFDSILRILRIQTLPIGWANGFDGKARRSRNARRTLTGRRNSDLIEERTEKSCLIDLRLSQLHNGHFTKFSD